MGAGTGMKATVRGDSPFPSPSLLTTVGDAALGLLSASLSRDRSGSPAWRPNCHTGVTIELETT